MCSGTGIVPLADTVDLLTPVRWPDELSINPRLLMSDSTFQRASLAGVATAVMTGGVVLTGWVLLEFDRALFVYAQALVLSFSLTVYRMVVWMHRPATAKVYRQAGQAVWQSRQRLRLGAHLLRRCLDYFAANRFVALRGWNRWAAHWPVMIGCLLALATVVPLVFGWVWFETVPDDLSSYRVMNFGVHVATIPVDGVIAFVAFHALVWAAIPVLIGCSVAVVRRWRDRGDAAVQTFAYDILPLLALLSIAVSGLLLTVSYAFLGGRFHSVIAGFHMVAVCLTLLWLPYSKLLHIPQRSLKLAHMICEFEYPVSGAVTCRRCGQEFADQRQIDDLIHVQQTLGYRYELPEETSLAQEQQHYQFICPQCRRAALVLCQTSRWSPNANVSGS